MKSPPNPATFRSAGGRLTSPGESNGAHWALRELILQAVGVLVQRLEYVLPPGSTGAKAQDGLSVLQLVDYETVSHPPLDPRCQCRSSQVLFPISSSSTRCALPGRCFEELTDTTFPLNPLESSVTHPIMSFW